MKRFIGATQKEFEVLQTEEGILIDGFTRWLVLQNIEKKRRMSYIYLGFTLAIICYLCSGFIF